MISLHEGKHTERQYQPCQIRTADDEHACFRIARMHWIKCEQRCLPHPVHKAYSNGSARHSLYMQDLEVTCSCSCRSPAA